MKCMFDRLFRHVKEITILFKNLTLNFSNILYVFVLFEMVDIYIFCTVKIFWIQCAYVQSKNTSKTYYYSLEIPLG